MFFHPHVMLTLESENKEQLSVSKLVSITLRAALTSHQQQAFESTRSASSKNGRTRLGAHASAPNLHYFSHISVKNPR